MTRMDFPTDFAINELLDVIEHLMDFSRACTFDEVEGEAEAADRARVVLNRYRSATDATSATTSLTAD
jgi:hypothetical protein